MINNPTSSNNRISSASFAFLNAKLATDIDYMQELSNYLANMFQSLGDLFINPSDFISSIIVYPINLLKPYIGKIDINTGLISSTSDVEAVLLENGDCVANLDEWYCKPYFNNFADYAGYTIIKVFLPFLGIVELPVNEIMGKFVQIRLNIDYNNGSGMYMIGVTDNSIMTSNDRISWRISRSDLDSNTRIISTHTFQLGQPLPVGSMNSDDIYRNLLLGATKIATTASGFAIGGMIGANTTHSILSSSTSPSTYESIQTVRNPTTNRQITQSKFSAVQSGETSTKTRTTDYTSRRASQTVNQCLDVATTSLSSIHIQGETTNPNNPAVFFTSPLRPYFLIYRPKFKNVGDDYIKLYGKPLGEVKKLKNLGGYTEISQLHLEGEGFSSATETEKDMLNEILRSGIILPKYDVNYYNIFYSFNNVVFESKPTQILKTGDSVNISLTVIANGYLNLNVSGASIGNILINGVSSSNFPLTASYGTTISFDVYNPTSDVSVISTLSPYKSYNVEYEISNIEFIEKPVIIGENGSAFVEFSISADGTLSFDLRGADIRNIIYNGIFVDNMPSDVSKNDKIRFEIFNPINNVRIDINNIPDKYYNISYNISSVEMIQNPSTIPEDGTTIIEFSIPARGTLDFEVNNASIKTIYVNGILRTEIPTDVSYGDIIQVEIYNPTNNVTISIINEPIQVRQIPINYYLGTDVGYYNFKVKPTTVPENGFVTVTLALKVTGNFSVTLFAGSYADIEGVGWNINNPIYISQSALGEDISFIIRPNSSTGNDIKLNLVMDR